MRFSANLGFLWRDLALPQAIAQAHAAGFDAVECHWPYDFDVAKVKAALSQSGLPMLGLNTGRGDVAKGENGLSALPGRQGEAREAIDQALDYALGIDCQSIHVMAGVASGDAAQAVFLQNLQYACARAAPHGVSILIEPLNAVDAPGYFLRTTEQALALIAACQADNLALMFDCYHVARTEGDVLARLDACLDAVGHIQIASVPDRAEPDHGDLDYAPLFARLTERGYTRPIGAEYRPADGEARGLSWLAQMRR